VTVAAGNQTPTASFTTSVNALTASVNGSPSSDPDGTISSWSWNFGDSSTGTGSTSSHTYDTAGTYTISLTVTDNGGATATTTRTVTVASAGGTTTLARDAFERTSTSGWGAAEVGGTWSATGTSYVVNSGSAAAVHSAAATTRRSLLSGVSSASSDITVQVALDKASTGGGVSVGAVGRQVGADFYQARIRFLADGTVGLQLLTGSSTVLGNTTIAGLTYAPGSTLVLRAQVSGTNPTTIRGKVWAMGSAEPAAWQLTATDTTAALQTTGSIGLESYVSSSATNAPLTVRYDNFSASSVG
jgi:PKD repeat protein